MSRSSLFTISSAALACALTACAGAFPGDQSHEAAARRNVAGRVGFDLGCRNPEVARLGDVARLGQQMTRMNLGVRCGDKRASYTVTCVSNWGDISCTPELNSASAAR